MASRFELTDTDNNQVTGRYDTMADAVAAGKKVKTPSSYRIFEIDQNDPSKRKKYKVDGKLDPLQGGLVSGLLGGLGR